jgi:hypothetical protein
LHRHRCDNRAKMGCWDGVQRPGFATIGRFWVACLLAVARGHGPPTPVGLRRGSLRYDRACLAEARGASEGWWGKKDSNLRSHKTADLQSAPFATRDTPPLNPIASPPAGMATDMAIDDVKTGRRWRTPGRAVYGGIAMAKSTNGRRLIRAARGSNCHNAEPVTQACHGRS